MVLWYDYNIKKLLFIVVILLIAGGIFYLIYKPSPEANTNQVASDYKNTSYNIEGEVIQLKNGASETEVTPGSAEKIITEYFGNETRGDFNNDGTQDVAFIITQSGGGTGTFYYVVVALETLQGYQGTNGILLGDRIAPQTTEFQNGEIIVNYADRKPGEPFSTDPSVGVSKYFKVSDGGLIEIQK